MNNSHIGVLKNINFFFRISSNNYTNFNIKFYKDTNSLPSNDFLHYLVIEVLSQEEFNELFSYLKTIRYTPQIILLYKDSNSVHELGTIINDIQPRKAFPESIDSLEFWKLINYDSITSLPQFMNMSSHYISAKTKPSSFKIDNSSIENSILLKNIISIINMSYYTQNLEDIIFHLLKTISYSYNIESMACYLHKQSEYFFYKPANNFTLTKNIPKKEVQKCINNMIKQSESYIILENEISCPFYSEINDSKNIFIYPILRQNETIGFFLVYYSNNHFEHNHFLKNILNLHSNFFVPIYFNQKFLNQLKQRNIEYDRMFNDLNHLYDELQIHSVVLDQIREITRKIYSTLKLDKIINELVNDISHLLNTEYSLIFFSFDQTERLQMNDNKLYKTLKLYKNKKEYIKYMKDLPRSQTILKRDLLKSDDIVRKLGLHKIRNYLGVPLPGNEDIEGWVFVFNKESSYTETDIFMLRALAESGVNAMQNAQLLEHLDKMFLNTINTLAATIEARDKYTGKHTERVGQYSVRIAKALGWQERKLKEALYGGILHDIGKIGIDDAILRKPEKLTIDEFDSIKKHCEIGFNIINNIEELKTVGNYILFHHEKYDGSGYPFGYKGEEIPIEGRIVAIADVFDAITTNRIYRKALSIEHAIEEIKKCRGKHFDPKLADIFINLYENHQLDDILEELEK